VKYDTHRCDEGERSEHQPDSQAQCERTDGVTSWHELGIRKRGAVTRRATLSTPTSAEPRNFVRILSQPRSALYERAVDLPKQRDAAYDARSGAQAIHEGAPGRGCARNGRERPVAVGQQEEMQGDVFARREEGRDRSAWNAPAKTGRRRAGAQWHVAEGFGG
jgi:hypothetical protein